MKNRNTGIVLILSAVAALAPPSAWAAGPGAFVTPAGVPYKWDNTRPITFSIDLGPLGRLNNRRAAEIVLNAFDEWQNVDTARLQFEEGDLLDRDVTAANFGEFIEALPEDVNPIILDQTGAIVDGLLGGGASRSVLAFSQIMRSTPEGLIQQARIILNGRAIDGLFDPDDLTEAELTRYVVQAIGQMLNLGASDVNDELIYDGNVENNVAVPIMNPRLVLRGGSTPTLDDRMSVSMLYPSTTFAANTGVIRGQVVLPDGTTGLQGISVIARKVDDPVNSAVSAVTGNTFRNAFRFGSRDINLRGAFEIRVPPGSYTVEIRPLRTSIGPLQGVFPLPGGVQYYQTTPAATGGPADPASATPVTVTAGQTTEIKMTAIGPPAPAPQTVTEVEPNDTSFQAALLPLSATVTGRIDPATDSVTSPLSYDPGTGTPDKIRDLYRLVVPERSILTVHLAAASATDLDLHVFSSTLGSAPTVVANSRATGTEAEARQLVLTPGTYYLGISVREGGQNAGATDYTMSVTTTPSPAETVTPLKLDQLVIGNITSTGAEARWTTDQDATGDSVVGMPRQQFGDPAAARAHRTTVTGLTAGAMANLQAFSQTPGGVLGGLPKVFFRVPSATAAAGPVKLTATVLGVSEEADDDDDPNQNPQLVLIGIHNTGGDAANVQLTGLQGSSGWRLATPVTEPLPIGGIGSGGTAVVLVRLLREGTGPAPLVSVTGTGTFAGADGAATNFTLGQP